jgi:hypothetical protein
MNKREDNKGLTGIDSIRLNGMKLDALPLAESAIAKEQWSQVQANEVKNKIEAIIGRYPKPSVAYLNGAISECQLNIKRIKKFKSDQDTMISEYTIHIRLCGYRDDEIAKLDQIDDHDEIRRLKIKYPPYDIPAMEQQIKQCKEAMERCDDVIEQENDSIRELSGVLALCKQRDAELKHYGVIVG